ncbi:acyltransferase [Stenotrophomonas sp. MMGLT7]|uniref:acyltransferase n=1 Tax=Stenotrophomonas sp. MMGLT7 TaxID=2901227 RepID=UPI001E3E1A52|nr:acyltransferase [Stenotrophomonas sp. MMGLT7]MCD7099311.1 hypothetical protein [Stenotrophomonas sp. MMGLT7]
MRFHIKRLLANRVDLFYGLEKGLGPMVRGLLWQILHLRQPRLLFIGAGVRFICSTKLELGRGVSIGAYSYIETCSISACRFEDRVTLRENAWVQCRSGFNEPGARLVIGTGAYIGPNAVIGVGGPISIGENCQIGAGLALAAEQHVLGEDGSFTSGTVTREGISIGARCWLGNNVTILDGVVLGEDCVVGAGAVVTKSLPAGSVAVGVPARVVRNHQKQDIR